MHGREKIGFNIVVLFQNVETEMVKRNGEMVKRNGERVSVLKRNGERVSVSKPVF